MNTMQQNMKILPEEKQKEVIDFVQFLIKKYGKKENHVKKININKFSFMKARKILKNCKSELSEEIIKERRSYL